jgi:hypothetical protein
MPVVALYTRPDITTVEAAALATNGNAESSSPAANPQPIIT